VSDTLPVDTERNSLDTIRTIKLPTRRPAERRSEAVPLGMAEAEAYAAIAACFAPAYAEVSFPRRRESTFQFRI